MWGKERRLLRICKSGKIDVALRLLKRDVDVNAKDKDGYTPLHAACLNNHVDIVRLLLEHGADVNMSGPRSQSPLHCTCGGASAIWSARGGVVYRVSPRDYYPVIRFLLEKGADVNVRDDDGATPLDQVLSLPPDDPAREEILDLFREYAPETVMEAYCAPGPGGMR